jgi:precorrin-8X/cobalt-precorrin-8 methylmutase
MLDYIRDGQEIYRNSFAIIRAEANLARIPADLEKLAVRVIHACGMVDAIDGLQFSSGAGQAGRDALAAGAPILCDARMVSEGITRARLPANNQVICTLRDDSVPQMARELGNTRSAVALELWRPHLEGSVVVLFAGNARRRRPETGADPGLPGGLRRRRRIQGSAGGGQPWRTVRDHAGPAGR